MDILATKSPRHVGLVAERREFLVNIYRAVTGMVHFLQWRRHLLAQLLLGTTKGLLVVLLHTGQVPVQGADVAERALAEVGFLFSFRGHFAHIL